MSDEQFALSPSAPLPPTEADYEAIATAVMETVRGRWFLGEFAKRNRNADTQLILAAIERVEALWRDRRPISPAERVRFDLVEMARAIAQMRAEIAAIKPEGDDKGTLSGATEELGSIVQTTEQATSDILAAAEQVQEIAWTLRERGADGESCDALDRRATDIYSACSFQDLTGQRTRKVVDVLRFLEDRIRAMIDIWGGEAAPISSPPDGSVAAPPRLGDDETAAHLDQPDIDRMMPASLRGDARPGPAQGSRSGHDVAAADPAASGAHVFDAGHDRANGPDTAAPAASFHLDGAAPAAGAAPAEPKMAPAAAVLGATALALDFAPAEIARAPEPEAAEEPSAARPDPAAVLRRILEIIRVPSETSADDRGSTADAVAPESTAPSVEKADPVEVEIVTAIAVVDVVDVAVADIPVPDVPVADVAAVDVAAVVAPEPAPPAVENADPVVVEIVTSVAVVDVVDVAVADVPVADVAAVDVVVADVATMAVPAAEAAAVDVAVADVAVADVPAADVTGVGVAATDIGSVAAATPSADRHAAAPRIEDDIADDILMPLLGPITVAEAVDEMLMKVPLGVAVVPPRAATTPIAPVEPIAVVEPVAAVEPVAVAEAATRPPVAAKPEELAPATLAIAVHAAQPFAIEAPEIGVAPAPEPAAEATPEPIQAAAPDTTAAASTYAPNATAAAPAPDATPAGPAPELSAAPDASPPADDVPAVADDLPEREAAPTIAPPPQLAATMAALPFAADAVPVAAPASPPPPLAAPAPPPVAALAVPPIASRPLPPKPAAAPPRHDAFAAIAALSDEEKIALFS